MKIAVLSDSHVNDLNDLPKKAIKMFENVDLVIHAGDYTGKRLFDKLHKLGTFEGVIGNMDSLSLGKKFPNKSFLNWVLLM